MKKSGLLLASLLAFAPALRAELKLPAIIGDHMILQQKQFNPIWGWDTPGTKVTVKFGSQTHTATAGSDGKWTVKLNPVAASANPQTLTISGSNQRALEDVLVGEVWMCSGQSNMGFVLGRGLNGDIEAAASNLPNLRLIKVPPIGTQELASDFRGEWSASTPETARNFSAVGFLYGRTLHQVLGVPVGLIDNAWGGSAAEAWIRRSSLEKDPRFKPLMERTAKREAELESPKGRADFAKHLAGWKIASADPKTAKKAGPRPPLGWLAAQHRPGNIFAGMVNPTLGYGIKGVIWYQGETNVPQAHEYHALFPFMVEQWRQEWKQGDFPFYWVQLADFKAEKAMPAESDWAELREAQTKALKLPNTGQAVIIDVGEGKDIHPRNKHEVAARLVRWALARDYGLKFPFRSPEFKSMTIAGSAATITIDCFGSTLRPFDTKDAKGFALCGEDKVWHWAKGEILGPDTVRVKSAQVAKPVAVRYAWADNPVCNLFSNDGLPVTPFRTDDFPMSTTPKP